jgi:hypothetical protein
MIERTFYRVYASFGEIIFTWCFSQKWREKNGGKILAGKIASTFSVCLLSNLRKSFIIFRLKSILARNTNIKVPE